MHITQILDMFFVERIDELLNEKILPDYLVKQLLESLANHATAEYLMPREYFENKFEETQNLQELADYFGVSVESVKIRIKILKLDKFMYIEI